MKEAVERIDSGALFIVLGESEKGAAQAAASRRRFEDELRVEERNITEPGETDAAARLRKLWSDYQTSTSLRRAAGGGPEGVLLRRSLAGLRRGQGCRRRRSRHEPGRHDPQERPEPSARRQDWSRIIFMVGLTGCILALVASSAWMTRLLRPLSVVEAAARRIGEGDLAVPERSSKGAARCAARPKSSTRWRRELQKYRDSSLGELLQAQQDLQAAIDSLPDPVLVIASGGELLHANRAAEALLGVKLSEAVRLARRRRARAQGGARAGAGPRAVRQGPLRSQGPRGGDARAGAGGRSPSAPAGDAPSTTRSER